VVGNLFIGEPSGDEDEHLSFPLGQRGILQFSHSYKVQALRGLVNANLVCVAAFVKLRPTLANAYYFLAALFFCGVTFLLVPLCHKFMCLRCVSFISLSKPYLS